MLDEFDLHIPVIDLVIDNVKDFVKEKACIGTCICLVAKGSVTSIKTEGNKILDKKQKDEKMLLMQFEFKGDEEKDVKVYSVRSEWSPVQLEYLPYFSGDVDVLQNILDL